MRRPNEILDARDRRVPAFRLPWTRRDQLRHFTSDEVERINASLSDQVREHRRWRAIITTTLTVVVMYFALTAIWQPGVLSIAFAAFFAIQAIVFRLIKLRSRVWYEDISPQMLAIGRCPSCTYQLDAGRAEPDACTLCPECGAAWKLGDAR